MIKYQNNQYADRVQLHPDASAELGLILRLLDCVTLLFLEGEEEGRLSKTIIDNQNPHPMYRVRIIGREQATGGAEAVRRRDASASPTVNSRTLSMPAQPDS